MTTVAVFGGTGFVGGAVVRTLCEAGFTVRSASRRLPASRADGVSYVVADVTDEESARRAVEDAAAVVNAVSLYSESGDATFEAVHVAGAARLARCAKEAGSTVLVHVSGLGVTADSPSAFVRARAAGEESVHRAFGQAVVVRPSVMFGRDDAFLKAIEQVTRVPVVPLFGRGGTRLQPAYVGDVASAVAKIIQGGQRRTQVYELGGPEVLSYREIMLRVMRHLGRRGLLLPVPFAAWKALAGAMAVLPSPPLTRDQILLLERDNVVSAGMPTFADLGISPAALTPMLDHCLARRPGG